MELSAQIKKYRAQLQLSQEELADRVYVMKFGKIVATRLPPKEKEIKSRHKMASDRSPALSVRKLSVFYGN